MVNSRSTILGLRGRTICLLGYQEASHLRMMEAVTGEVGTGPVVRRLGMMLVVQLWKGLAEAEDGLEACRLGLACGWRVWGEEVVECLYHEQSTWEERTLPGKCGGTANMTLSIGAVEEARTMVAQWSRKEH